MAGNEIEELAKAGTATAKLLDTIFKGIGTLGNHFFKFDVKKIERISNAKTESKKREIISAAKAESEAALIKIETEDKLAERTQKRLLSQELKRQINIENTILLAKAELDSSKEKISDIPVDEDWATRFFNIVQDVNSEEIQVLWAKILAGEIRKPKSYSLRTLEVLKNISSEEASFFQLAVALSISNNYIILPKDINGLKDFGFDYDKILLLRDAGLISTGNNDNKTLEKTDEIVTINLPLKTKTLIIQIPKDKTYKVSTLNFTIAGTELAKTIQVETNEDYYQALKDFFISKGFKIVSI